MILLGVPIYFENTLNTPQKVEKKYEKFVVQYRVLGFSLLLDILVSCGAKEPIHFASLAIKGHFAQLHRRLKRPRRTPKNAIKPDTEKYAENVILQSFLLCRSPRVFAHADFVCCIYAAMEKNSTRHRMKGSLSAQRSPLRPTHTHTHTFFSSCWQGSINS
jgi:hypothetical protein